MRRVYPCSNIRRLLISLGLRRSLNIMVGRCPRIRSQVTLFSCLLAGRDTTASTLTFIVYMLAMHSRVLTRLRQEVLDKVGPIGIPNQNDIRDMKYLRAVINGTLRCASAHVSTQLINHLNKETLRLYPTLYVNSPYLMFEHLTLSTDHSTSGK